MSAPYELQLQSNADAGPDVFTFRAADGVVSKDEFRPAELALLETVEPGDGDDVLVVDANYGVVGTVLATLADRGETLLTETSARAARLTADNVARNDATADVSLTPNVGGGPAAFDVAAYAPKPYDPTRVVGERIASALSRLEAGGALYVAAAKTDGIVRYADAMVDLTGDAEKVLQRGGLRVYRCRKPEGYEPARYVDARTVTATVDGTTCEFATRPGLFSPTELDQGTELLLSVLDVGPDENLLDLCCGYGPVGVVAAKRTGCPVWLTDDDCVAVSYARRNADRNDVAPRGVVAADGTRGVAGHDFDVVAANPPTHAGEGVTRELFQGAREVLAGGGRFVLVYNDVLGYERDLDVYFDEVEVLLSEAGYSVTVARVG